MTTETNGTNASAKLLAGSVLAGLSLLAVVVDAWAGHFFFAAFHLARAAALESTGSFDPAPYGSPPEATGPVVATRALAWLLLAVGLGLLVWGVRDAYDRQP